MNNLESNLIYLAAFFDAEGCLAVAKGKHKNTWAAQVVNQDAGILGDYLSAFGGKISPVNLVIPHRKPLFTWHVCGANLRRFLIATFPYLRHTDKKSKALEALSVDEERRSDGRQRIFGTGGPKGKSVTKKCEGCGEDFVVLAYLLRRRRFCSVECRSKVVMPHLVRKA